MMVSGSKYERELKDILEDEGCIVIRSAGSMGEGDLVAIARRGDSTDVYIIECKSTNKNVYYSSNDPKQFKTMKDNMQEYKDDFIFYIYAVRWKDRTHKPKKDKWEFYDPTETEIMRKNEGYGLIDLPFL